MRLLLLTALSSTLTGLSLCALISAVFAKNEVAIVLYVMTVSVLTFINIWIAEKA